jgi:thymidylate synthase (FAD)
MNDGDSGRRFISAEAEQWIGRKIPCLDRGFVYLVDYMGGDPSIVQAARVSYGLGTKSVSEDRGLIRYLMRHQHSTPFEMVELKFHVKLPIFVARQWIRHRTACLAGDSDLFFDLPGARKRGRRHCHRMSISKFHRLWHEGTRHPLRKKKALHLDRVDSGREYSVPEIARLVGRREETIRNTIRAGKLRARRVTPRNLLSPSLFVLGGDWHEYAQRPYEARVRMKERLQRMQLRMCDESTGEIGHTRVADVWESGVKAVYRVTLENGYALKMTADHRCLTERGWMTLGEATHLRVRMDGGISWAGDAPAFAVNGLAAYRDRDWLAAERSKGHDVATIAERAGTSYHTIRKYLRQFGLQFDSRERARLSGLVQRGQRRTFSKARIYTQEHLRVIRAARSGVRSNFWKGGVTPERANVGRWTREHAARVHARFDYSCVICASKNRLHAHHVDPVWNNPARARDIENLATLCQACHSRIHALNLELQFLDAMSFGVPSSFWDRAEPAARPARKRKPQVRRLVRTFSRIRRIESAGSEMTYDLAVAGPYHNFVANGLIVHNSVNEYSGRYSVMPDEFYTPELQHVTSQSKTNRQGGAECLDEAQAAEVLRILTTEQRRVRSGYDRMIELDVRRELARINLGVSQYTEWYWKNDLHNVFHFLQLRLDAHAQHEIRVYAEAMAQIVRAVAPIAWEAFEDYQLNADRLSRLELETLGRLLDGGAGWPDAARVEAAMPEAWREKNAKGELKRNREREEFLAKLARLAERRAR